MKKEIIEEIKRNELINKKYKKMYKILKTIFRIYLF